MATVSAFVLYDKISSFLELGSLSSKVEHQHVVEYACCDHEHKGDGAGIVHLPTFSTRLVLAQDGRPPTFLSNQTILVVQVVGALA